ncbi:SRPBCC family protein [Nitriliruptoraceae bacterium ZYF776]|nr:SRPBCC family protein [Profundirhabdus halotolerans]
MVDIARTVAGGPTAAWELLADTRQWPRWGPTVAAVEADPPVVVAGSRGRVRTSVGVWLPFEVTEVDAGHRWAWRVAGVPATGHRVEATPAGTRVVFEVPVLAAPYALVCLEALRRIDRLLRTDGG